MCCPWVCVWGDAVPTLWEKSGVSWSRLRHTDTLARPTAEWPIELDGFYSNHSETTGLTVYELRRKTCSPINKTVTTCSWLNYSTYCNNMLLFGGTFRVWLPFFCFSFFPLFLCFCFFSISAVSAVAAAVVVTFHSSKYIIQNKTTRNILKATTKYKSWIRLGHNNSTFLCAL